MEALVSRADEVDAAIRAHPWMDFAAALELLILPPEALMQ